MADEVLNQTNRRPISRVSPLPPVSWRRRLVGPLVIFVAWRVWFGLVSLWAASLPATLHGRTTPYNGPALDFWGDRLLGVWSHWDGEWFLYVAQAGYRPEDFSTPYFPLYPLLVRMLSPLTLGSQLVAGVLLSNLFALTAFVLLYELIRYEIRPAVATRTLTALAAFPTSFFLVACYSESLFLSLALGAFLAVRRFQNWWLAGLLVGLAAITRNIGILLLVPLGWESIHDLRFTPLRVLAIYDLRLGNRGRKEVQGVESNKGLGLIVEKDQPKPRSSIVNCKSQIANRTWLWVLPGLFYGGWLLFLAITQGNPFSFVSAVSQPAWQRHSAWPWQTLASVVAVWRGEPYPRLPDSWPVESLLIVFVLVMFGVACYQTWRRQLAVCYLLYFAVALFVPLAAPNLDDPLLSFPRYIMIAFPMYLIIAQARPVFRLLYLLLAFSLLTFLMAQFANWYWVA